MDDPPALVVSEPDPARPDEWRLDALFTERPDADAIALVLSLVPSCDGGHVEPLPAADWVTMSQSGLAPVRAGRFFVHTDAHRGAVPEGAVAFEIAAGLAFGTGHHETTAGCLEMLEALSGERFADIADIGTGTGLLAFAARAVWPEARVLASDVDPVAIEVSAANARINRVPLGEGAGEVALVVADGMDDAAIAGRAPYDLLIANILAAPLVSLAPAIAAALASRGSLVLAGLLCDQADAVEAAYRNAGVEPRRRLVRGDWAILHLVRA